MAQEPTGWSWVGTHLFGDQVVFFDRCTTEADKGIYGHYQFDPFHQTLVRDDDSITTSGTDKLEVARMIVAIDTCIEITDQVSSVEEVILEDDETAGYFPSNRLPFCKSNSDLSGASTSEKVWFGCSNSTSSLAVLDDGKGKIDKTVWQYVKYWRNFEAITSSRSQTINTEWFIPSIEELEELYNSRSYLMGITRSISQLTSDQFSLEDPFYIWSSTLSGTQVSVLDWNTGEVSQVDLTTRTPRLILCRYI